MTKWITGIAATLVVAILALQGSSVASAQGGTVAPNPEDVTIAQGPTIRQDVKEGKIFKDSDGHFQVVVILSSLNENSVTGEIEVLLDSSLYAYTGTGGPSGGSSALLIPMSRPVSPGTAEPYDLWIQAGPSARGDLEVSGIVRYWPIDPVSGVENKAAVKTLSWSQKVEVVEPSDPFGVPREVETPPAETPTPPTNDNDNDNGDPFEWEPWMYFVIAIIGILALIAIMRIIMN